MKPILPDNETTKSLGNLLQKSNDALKEINEIISHLSQIANRHNRVSSALQSAHSAATEILNEELTHILLEDYNKYLASLVVRSSGPNQEECPEAIAESVQHCLWCIQQNEYDTQKLLRELDEPKDKVDNTQSSENNG